MKKILIIILSLVVISAVVAAINNINNKPKAIQTKTKAKIEKINKEIKNSKTPNANLYAQSGIIKYKNHNYKGAIEDFNKAKEIYKQQEAKRMANEKEMLSKYPNMKMPEQRPQMINTIMYQNSAKANERTHNYQEAINDYNEILKSRPNDKLAKKEIERIQQKMNK